MLKANYRAAENAAYGYLNHFGMDRLPIPLEKFNYTFSDLRIRSYSWFANKNKIDISEVVDFADSDSGCCWYMPDSKKHMILFNDTITTPGHIRWTIAHELGHYALKHNEKTNRTVISRSNITSNEYLIFEQEANCFARTLLAPTNILLALKKFDVKDLTKWCGISKVAATNVMRFFNKGIEIGKSYDPNDRLVESFKKYIYINNHEKQCTHCNHYFINPSSSYCPVCGTSKILKKRGSSPLIYFGHSLNENNYPRTCPQCDNEEFTTGEHCKICGTTVVNKCTGSNSQVDYYGRELQCGTYLEGNARYCSICGSKSTYLTSGHLVDWKEARSKNLLTETDLDLSDLDLPF